jgi:hypothetical protein
MAGRTARSEVEAEIGTLAEGFAVVEDGRVTDFGFKSSREAGAAECGLLCASVQLREGICGMGIAAHFTVS